MSRSWARVTSPEPGRSTLMTSAPNQASSAPQNGPARTWPSSRTRKPWSGRGGTAVGTASEVTTTTYLDTFGKPVLQIHGDGSFVLMKYDLNGTLLRPFINKRDHLGEAAAEAKGLHTTPSCLGHGVQHVAIVGRSAGARPIGSSLQLPVPLEHVRPFLLGHSGNTRTMIEHVERQSPHRREKTPFPRPPAARPRPGSSRFLARLFP